MHDVECYSAWPRNVGRGYNIYIQMYQLIWILVQPQSDGEHHLFAWKFVPVVAETITMNAPLIALVVSNKQITLDKTI